MYAQIDLVVFIEKTSLAVQYCSAINQVSTYTWIIFIGLTHPYTSTTLFQLLYKLTVS